MTTDACGGKGAIRNMPSESPHSPQGHYDATSAAFKISITEV